MTSEEDCCNGAMVLGNGRIDSSISHIKYRDHDNVYEDMYTAV
jgi:hypothetical protein